tara:strand:- start:1178 stop:1789 length:612 start_codon:yes stop_codon:yes gene_type:complete
MDNSVENNVKQFYNNNYEKFDNSRYSIWKAVRNFVDNIAEDSLVLDAGCGNGKNMLYMQARDIKVIGIDFCDKLLNICKEKVLNVKYADVRNIPFENNTFDYVISIAVIHHLSIESDRRKAIDEMLRVCKPNGKILVSVWALEQDKNSRFKFRLGDNIVKWDDSTRFYHIHSKDTITDLLQSYNVESIFLDKGNWYFIIKNRI